MEDVHDSYICEALAGILTGSGIADSRASAELVSKLEVERQPVPPLAAESIERLAKQAIISKRFILEVGTSPVFATASQNLTTRCKGAARLEATARFGHFAGRAVYSSGQADWKIVLSRATVAASGSKVDESSD